MLEQISIKQKYVYYDEATGKIIGFYNQCDTIPIPEPHLKISEEMYNIYFSNIGKKDYRIIDNVMVEYDEVAQLSLTDYKSLKSAHISYEGRLRLSKPFAFENNFYDVYNLWRNYFDQRFIQEISTKKTNIIKLQTINDRLVPMNSEKFLEFYIAYTKHNRELIDTMITLLDSILDCNTKEEIDLVKWPEYQPTIYPAGSKFMPLIDPSNLYRSFIDAPNDGKVYGRQQNHWVEIVSNIGSPLPSNPPNDNKIYGRQYDSWVEIPAPPVSMPEPPNDGRLYARRYNEWVALP